MARIPDAFIDELLARTDIVALIGERLELKRAGREFHARCPFHDERTPSFTVSPAKQFYHCFGCAAHGTALKFLMEYERLEFLDAVEDLAQRAGLTVPRETHTRHSQGFEDLYGVLASATTFFANRLDVDAKALAYLKVRDVDEPTRRAFALGYAPDAWDALKSELGNDEHRLRLLESAGLVSKSDSGRVYDKFRDRLMFPIEDRRGRVIAFGGRVIVPGVEPKYLNSPETPLFHKGRELFGLHRARQAQTRLDRLIVVEGYMDVVALVQSGITQAVATLGTAVTADQVELMFRSAQDVYFCFDGDRAGRAAAWRAVENTLPRMRDGRQAHFLFLPEGQDPDSIIRSEGASQFEARLNDATPLSKVFFDELGRDISFDSLEGRARLAERLKPLLEKIPDGAFRDLMRERSAELTGLRTATPGTAEARRADRIAPLRGKAPGSTTSLVRKSIAMLIQQPSLALSIEPPYRFATLRQPGAELLTELILHVRAHPELHTGQLLEHWEGREEHPALVKVASHELAATPETWSVEFLEAIGKLDRQTLDQQIDELLIAQKQRPLTLRGWFAMVGFNPNMTWCASL
ncbi:MAG: DNA primase, partial [Lysobacterales bacterium]